MQKKLSINSKDLNNAILLLETGEIFWGKGLGPKKISIGEFLSTTEIFEITLLLNGLQTFSFFLLNFHFPFIRNPYSSFIFLLYII